MTQRPTRRHFMGGAAALAGASAGWGLSGTQAQAQAQAPKYPQRPITLIVPFPAGGSVDGAGRAIGERLAHWLGQPVIVDNKGGAGGTIGTVAAAKAVPDGHTLIVTSQTTHVVNPAMNPKLPYDPLQDFAPITLIERLANVLVVNASLPVKTFAEFVAHVRARPGKWNYASSGGGSVANLSMELLKSKLGLFITHIPYRGAGPALNDLLSGQIEVSWNNLSSNLPMIQNGKLRALAVAASTRVPLLPDVPTFAELRLPELNLSSWAGLAAPARTPEPIVQQLYLAVRSILKDPATQEAWAKRGAMVPEDLAPAAYRREIEQRIGFYREVARANKIVLD